MFPQEAGPATHARVDDCDRIWSARRPLFGRSFFPMCTGATCSTDLDASCTHVVAAKDGSKKVRSARKAGVRVVHVAWLWACACHFSKLSEDDFDLAKCASAQEQQRDTRSLHETSPLVFHAPQPPSAHDLCSKASAILLREWDLARLWVHQHQHQQPPPPLPVGAIASVPSHKRKQAHASRLPSSSSARKKQRSCSSQVPSQAQIEELNLLEPLP